MTDNDDKIYIMFNAAASLICISLMYVLVQGIANIAVQEGIHEPTSINLVWGLGIVTGMLLISLSRRMYELWFKKRDRIPRSHT